MAQDVAQLYQDLGIEKANVLGHSMGGRCMMLFALKFVSKFFGFLIIYFIQLRFCFQFPASFSRKVDCGRH